MYVLVVGDSHVVGAPGTALAARWKARGATIVRMAEVGWGPQDWVEMRPGALEAAAQEPFDAVFLWFGTNDAATPETAAALERLHELWPNALFVGPPSYRDQALAQRASALIRMEKKLFGARFIDAQPMTRDLPRGADGIHFGQEAGAIWAERLDAALRTAPYKPLVLSFFGIVAGGLLAFAVAG